MQPENTRQLTDGTVIEVSPEELEEARSRAEAILESGDVDKMMLRTCWNCNGAHFHLAEADNVILRCFGCGRFYIDGIDITTTPRIRSNDLRSTP